MNYRNLPTAYATIGQHSLPLPAYAGIREEPEVHNRDFQEPCNVPLTEHYEDNAPLMMHLLDDESKDAIVNYTKTSYALNDALRHKLHYGYSIDPAHQRQITAIDRAIEQHSAKPGFSVLSGLSEGLHSKFSSYGPSEQFVHFPAFTSTTTNRNIGLVAGRFARPDHTKLHSFHGDFGSDPWKHIIHLHVNSDKVPAMSVKPLAINPNEDEVLFHRGMIAKVHKTPKRFQDYLIWDAEVHDFDKRPVNESSVENYSKTITKFFG